MVNGIIINDDNLIEVTSTLGKRIRTTPTYWKHITTHKHTELAERLEDATNALETSDEVYRQDEQSDIFLYYKHADEYSICVIAKHLNGNGFIVTAYLTTKAKRKGLLVWHK